MKPNIIDGLFYRDKASWIRLHGITAHAWAHLGWTWTPKRCEHDPPHLLDTSEGNKK